MMFRFELNSEEPWLLGVEECVMARTTPKTKPVPAVNVVSLLIKDSQTVARRHLPQRENSIVGVSQTEVKMKEAKTQTSFGQVCKTNTVSLPINREAKGHTSTIFRPMRASGISKSFYSRPKSSQKQRTSESFFPPCPGKYCSVLALQYSETLPQHIQSRFAVPMEALFAAEQPDFSPLFHPKLLARPSHWQASTSLSNSAGRPMVMVCQRCCYVYSNVVAAMRDSEEKHRRSGY